MSDNEFIVEKNPESLESLRFRSSKKGRAVSAIASMEVGDRVIVKSKRNVATFYRAIREMGAEFSNVYMTPSKIDDEKIMIAFYMTKKPDVNPIELCSRAGGWRIDRD